MNNVTNDSNVLLKVVTSASWNDGIKATQLCHINIAHQGGFNYTHTSSHVQPQ